MTGRVLARLSLFFDRIHHLRPAESSAGEEMDLDPAVALLTRHAICRSYCPAPLLGEELAGYRRVVRELSSRKNDFGHRLNSLSLAALSDNAHRGDRDESADALRSAIAAPDGAGGDSGRQEQEIWQARLVLALGEIIDREAEEIEQRLARLAEQEQLLVDSLQGEGQDEESDEPLGRSLAHPSLATRIADAGGWDDRTLRHRLTAWTRLFLADPKGAFPDRGTTLLATGRPEVASLLLESYEQLREKAIPPLVSLTMPGVAAAPVDEFFMDRLAAFKEATAASRNRLVENLNNCLAKGGCRPDNALADAAAAWNETSGRHWPPATSAPPLPTPPPGSRLILYGFEGMTVERLLCRVAGLRPKDPSPLAGPGGGLLALLA